MTSTSTDLWHHFGRERAARDRAVPDAFRWTWGQDGGPGAEVLGNVSGLCVGDLGCGAARHAAYLASRHRPERVDAVDASPAQHAMAGDLYAHLAPRLRLVHADVVAHLRGMTGRYDVLYSVFGALDFTEPRELLPAAAAALRPGGRLVFATLAHYLGGEAARGDVLPADIPAKSPDGATVTMRRWVLREEVWAQALYESGLTAVSVDVLPASRGGHRTADTLLVAARRSVCTRGE